MKKLIENVFVSAIYITTVALIFGFGFLCAWSIIQVVS
jgi:hypothetical protein